MKAVPGVASSEDSPRGDRRPSPTRLASRACDFWRRRRCVRTFASGAAPSSARSTKRAGGAERWTACNCFSISAMACSSSRALRSEVCTTELRSKASTSIGLSLSRSIDSASGKRRLSQVGRPGTPARHPLHRGAAAAGRSQG
eukprot:scaffold1531_cov111-Isochrysis_galbana.AAC.8